MTEFETQVLPILTNLNGTVEVLTTWVTIITAIVIMTLILSFTFMRK